MGVAGCGKSSLAAAFARAEALTLIEGDAFHSADSVDKMSRGVALTDADRARWLERLGAELRAHPRGVVLTCSALRRAYRERLRAASPGLRFAFREIDRHAALVRVNARAGARFFSAGLVDSQFATLESPLRSIPQRYRRPNRGSAVGPATPPLDPRKARHLYGAGSAALVGCGASTADDVAVDVATPLGVPLPAGFAQRHRPAHFGGAGLETWRRCCRPSSPSD